ncbi:hypothetical protein HP499_22420, partial [Paenarthrobacter sp. CM16]|nr:hypothetical protein [Paenarthrobacter sp. CM16]
MISVFRRARRRLTAAAVAIAAGSSLLFAAPAQAYDTPDFEVPSASQAPLAYVQRASDAAGVMELWRTGGPATRAAAAAALIGGAAAVQAFVDGGQDAPLAADRKQLVAELAERGSEHVRSKAKEILASNNPALIDAFLATGWESTWRVDLKTVAYYFTEYNNGLVQREAQKSLDEGQQAVEEFVLSGWMVKAQVSDRQAAYALIASFNPAVSAGAKTALATTEPAADAAKVADYLRYGQFVAGDHHTESAATTALLQQVKADVKANPAGDAGVADRAKTAVEQARNTAAAARTADSARLVADRDLLSAHAVPRGALDKATLVSEKPAREAFAAAAKELPGLLAALSAPDADPEALIKEARQATLDLALVGTP